MENFTVTYRNLSGTEIKADFSDFNDLQEFMYSLLGKAFTAKITRWVQVPMTDCTKLTGETNVYSDTIENVWKKL